MKYRKTALVEAEQFLPADGKIPKGAFQAKGAQHWGLNTLEGIHELRDGDYVCTGPHGEQWNVKREIFEATYEPAE
jgi:hypothetical protein